MHKPSLTQLVYNATFPRPRASDPASFAAHITRNLVPEVRIETCTFYGGLDTIEAQYPGLDYSYKPHRLRLSRFPWHRRLFRVFDHLGLTEAEISSLCRWEGTKSARERYEKEEGVKVKDTTADTVQPAAPAPTPSAEVHYYEGTELVGDLDSPLEISPAATVVADEMSEVVVDYVSRESSDDESSDEEIESCGVELNNRLLAATAARERGANVPLDEVWEQWLKEASERGGAYAEMINAIRTGRPLNYASNNPTSPLPRSNGANLTTALAHFTGSYVQPSSLDLLASNTAIRRSSNQASGTA
ncbi:hypothetical protein ASPZODRAFT_1777244 [Penicilliopsis zonata CBS 506.65]|uniref:Uncharacterized protein n=1 Tax=Penicilliopsis zonata CBS 506.65 TaxID=1073090 RepID=A0A1L9SKN2_9EURO|nr:hypothetical protein ASPZODRAFT_1777244 [Penicilliopsis zonata CBS 506.65]OJJ47782.1 hypothetical protein ASPZODRAFT_1777244 [Penicilliopsis zonata CBS 506.65]